MEINKHSMPRIQQSWMQNCKEQFSKLLHAPTCSLNYTTSFKEFLWCSKIPYNKKQTYNSHSSSFQRVMPKCDYTVLQSYQPRRSARPLHSESVLTFLSINFFHSMPSEMTRYHSLQTNSAAQRESASRYERILSATWSKPFSATNNISQY